MGKTDYYLLICYYHSLTTWKNNESTGYLGYDTAHQDSWQLLRCNFSKGFAFSEQK